MVKYLPVILTFTSYYLPGFKGGGPIRTIASMVDILGDEFDFRIVTLDRDLGSESPYPDIKVGEWQQVGKAKVLYVESGTLTLGYLRNLINSTPHDIMYLNSCFSPRHAILPLLLRRLGLIKSAVTIVAPRGEFSKGALSLKHFKKMAYLYGAKFLGLYRSVTWQASSQHEKVDILHVFPRQATSDCGLKIIIAPDLSQPRRITSGCKKYSKESGSLKIVFVSRISPKKNLDGALTMLRGLQGEVMFDIYGPLEDMAYWEKCQSIIRTLPPSIQVHYRGIIQHEKVTEVFWTYDLFFFPTLGENYGHVIIEALVAGCPILISDQTPWRNLEATGVGWDIPLEYPEKFKAVLQQCVDMDCVRMQNLSERAMAYGIQKATDADVVQQNRDIFTMIERVSCSKARNS